MRDDMVLTVGELKGWLREARVHDSAVIRLNVGGHVGSATGHTVGWGVEGSQFAGDDVLVLTAEEGE